jgi:hypothetical protein
MLGDFVKNRFLLALLCATTMSLAWVSPSQAQLLDPSTLHVYNGTDFSTGPNPLGGTGALTIQQQSGGAPDLNPVLLIIGIPNDPSAGGNTFYSNVGNNAISSVTYSNGGTASWQLGGSNPFVSGVHWNAATGFAGTLNSSSGDAYSVIGVGGANNSNSFGNWQAGETAGQDAPFPPTNPGLFPAGQPSSFSLYVFKLSDPNGFPAGGTISVQFAAGELPAGAYAIAYSESTTHLYDTPFTEAGLEQSGGHGNTNVGTAPAPPGVVLMGTGIALLGLFGWSRRRALARAA